MEIFMIQTDLINSSKVITPQNDVVGLLFFAFKHIIDLCRISKNYDPTNP